MGARTQEVGLEPGISFEERPSEISVAVGFWVQEVNGLRVWDTFLGYCWLRAEGFSGARRTVGICVYSG